ncbi:NPCBM/NEW2 domain-containing protein [Actinomadura chokoriensis]|uniref:NPCBM/NEW2 domain-containing protein n=1 Tax=Actinomadura chokoriensis TaxID=454156 RepID=UPI0031F858C8
MTTNDQSDRGDRQKRPLWKDVAVIAALITAIGGVTAAVVQVVVPILQDGSGGQASAGGSASADPPARSPASSPPGSPLDSPPVTVASGAGETRYLSEMEPTSRNTSPTEDSVTLNGQTYTNSLTLRVGGCKQKATVTYALNREWRSFHTVVGVTSDSQPDTEIYYKFFVDNRQIGPERKTSKFKSEPVDFDVSNMQELEMRMSFVKGDMGLCSHAGRAAWGEATVTR